MQQLWRGRFAVPRLLLFLMRFGVVGLPARSETGDVLRLSVGFGGRPGLVRRLQLPLLPGPVLRTAMACHCRFGFLCRCSPTQDTDAPARRCRLGLEEPRSRGVLLASEINQSPALRPGGPW